MSSSSGRIDRRGRDDLSSFRVSLGKCGVCGKRGIVIRYDRVRERILGERIALLSMQPVYRGLSWKYILETPSCILRKAYPRGGARGEGALGLQCGCLTRFHRQLSHIADSVSCRENGGLGQHAPSSAQRCR